MYGSSYHANQKGTVNIRYYHRCKVNTRHYHMNKFYMQLYVWFKLPRQSKDNDDKKMAAWKRTLLTNDIKLPRLTFVNIFSFFVERFIYSRLKQVFSRLLPTGGRCFEPGDPTIEFVLTPIPGFLLYLENILYGAVTDYMCRIYLIFMGKNNNYTS